MRPCFRLLVAFGFITWWSCVAVPPLALGRPADTATLARVIADYGKLPMAFEVNQGQADPAVRFLTRGRGYGLYLTPTEAVLRLRGSAPASSAAPPEAVVRMRLEGANPQPELSGVDLLPGITNYFIGSDPTRWRTAVPNYARVRYKNIYSGIDLVFHGDQGGLEYDFIVAPGADPRRILLDFKGARNLALDSEGNLGVATSSGYLVQRKPVVYQDIDGTRRLVDGRYVLRGKHRVGFKLASYDRRRPLVIDPVLVYSTYLGGRGFEEQVSGLAVDSVGNVFVVGTNEQGGFPTTPISLQPAAEGIYRRAFVAKLNAAGTALDYSTYLGGATNVWGQGIAIDASGNAYVTGHTACGFPTTPGAFRIACAHPYLDFYVAKLSPAGDSLVYSTYLGADAGDELDMAIAVDTEGHAYVTGAADGVPTTPGAFQPENAGGYDAFVTKLNPAGTALVYSTYLGGSSYDAGYGIAVDAIGNVYVAGGTAGTLPTTAGAFQTAFGGGLDVFVAKLDPTGSALIYSTYLGGTEREEAYGIALDRDGNTYVAGVTGGDFPTTPGAVQVTAGGHTDAFVAKLNAAGTALVFATYLGGPAWDSANGIAVDRSGNAYVTGSTNGEFPTTTDATQLTVGGAGDAYVAKLNPSGTGLDYSTYLGGNGYDYGRAIAVDEDQNAYVAGIASVGFPTTRGAYQSGYAANGDAFVAKLGNFPNAIEYHHSIFGHYFVTSLASEIQALDAGTSIGWSRTGLSFRVFPLDAPGTANVCRFWSGQAFAPRSSHFYTPFYWECATAEVNPDWVFEGEVFAMGLPVVTGICRSGTVPLYRIYNNGKSGAPNHRYTTDRTIQEEMVAQGWIPEGYGFLGVIGCVPAP